MKYYRLTGGNGETILAVEVEGRKLASLTSIEEDLTSVNELALASSLSGRTIDEIASSILEIGGTEIFDLGQIIEESRAGEGDFWLDRPIDPPEVWAAGVTYKSSEMERRRESQTPDVYSMVYSADRPELFLKATPERCVGPFEAVGIRGDSTWNVPEPELAFVLYKGEIIGYTCGNDMSSRSIEGENPLYLPQAKLYDRCCAIGPCFVTPDAVGNPHDLAIQCVIFRNGNEVFRGETSTSLMARKCEDIAEWLCRHNTVPNFTTVLTGTAVVPPPDFTLNQGDTVAITIEGIGTLENEVVEV